MRRSIIMSSWLVLSTFFAPLAFAAPESLSELSERVEKIEEKTNDWKMKSENKEKRSILYPQKQMRWGETISRGG